MNDLPAPPAPAARTIQSYQRVVVLDRYGIATESARASCCVVGERIIVAPDPSELLVVHRWRDGSILAVAE
jgi:hypothetical protein